MHAPPVRLVLFFALFAVAGLFSRNAVAETPTFLTGTSTGLQYPDYSESFNSVIVGKSLVVPISVSGSGPMTYSATSSNPVVIPLVKTGYPVMNIAVSYSGTTAVSGTVDTLHSFTGGADGGNPYTAPLELTAGTFYGTTESGSSGFGSIYQLASSGSLTTLYSFTSGSDGANPFGGLSTGVGSFLYGTTEAGGTNSAGTLFEVTLSGSLTTLHTFTGGSDGGNPYGTLVSTGSSLYGTTSKGGAGYGTVFQLNSSGSSSSFTTLYSFTNGADGGTPYAGLITGTDGNLYGTTSGGGAGFGTVFQITTSGSLTTLYTFTGGNDGGNPYAGVIQGSNGNFYGTTETDGSNGNGTVYEVTLSGSLTTLHTFGALTSGRNSDGANSYAPLVQSSDGSFYGTTEDGGSGGDGTVFRMLAGGALSTVYSFTGGGDGGNPFAGLTQFDSNLYGATKTDGTGGFGTLYEITIASTPAFSGMMSFALLRDMAPTTVSYIAGFAQAGYYNNTDFFRITSLTGTTSGDDEFIAQGGDPTETGTGGPGFTFDNEFSPSLIFSGQGQLAMANAGIDQNTFRGTNSSQFFFTQGPTRSLDFGYTIFGQMLSGFDVMAKVMSVPLGADGSSPTVPVVMNSVTVTEDNNDAILLLSAAGAGTAAVKVNATDPSGNKAVFLSGTTSTPGLNINVDTADDTINDPPFLEPVADMTAGVRQKVSFPIKSVDLEFDYLIPNAEILTETTNASLKVVGNVVSITPNSTSPIGTLTAGLFVYQPFTQTERSDQYDQTAVNVGLGTGRLTPMPALFEAVPGGSLKSSTSGNIGGAATTFGSFLSSTMATGSNPFTATINWGDGSPLVGGTNTNAVSVAQSTYAPTTYDISSAGHTYSGAGIYPVNVTVTASNGTVVQLQNTAVVSAGNIHPFGRTFTAVKGSFDGLAATFVDYSSSALIPADFKATINWGDGSVNTGVVKGANGSFQIYGTHKYTGGTTYPVDVTVNSTINSDTGYAWSTAKLTGVPTRQPPFAQSHIVGQLGNPGFEVGSIDEEVTLVNSGNLASGPIALRFYLSPTAATDPMGSGAIPLSVGRSSVYNTVSIPAGSAIAGAVSDIVIPPGTVTRNKFLIMQVITSDPIGNHEDYPREFADPVPLIE